MAQKIKKFKIGERAVGGIIQVTIAGKAIIIKALEYDNPSVEVDTGSLMLGYADPFYDRRIVREYLQKLTDDYHVDKVLTWISDNSELPKTDW